MIGGAVAVAAVVLLVTLLAGPSAAPRRQQQVTPPGEADLPTGTGAPVKDLEHALPVLGSSYGEYAFQEGDRWTYLQFAEVTPLPDGVIDVIQPRALTHLSASRVLEMTADEATFVAPDNQPRQGDFRDNVVLTLYESQDGSPVDLESRRDVRMIVYLEQASFDLELGQVDSPGPVHLTGRNVDFRGRGLSLNYNPRRERLERLEIFEGESMRFRPDDEPADEAAAADGEGDAPGATANAEGAVGAEAEGEVIAEAEEAKEANAPDDDEGKGEVVAEGVGEERIARSETNAEAEAEAEPVDTLTAESDEEASDGDDDGSEAATGAVAVADEAQYYLARFQDEVRVRAPGDPARGEDDVTMTGDLLTAMFSLGGSEADDADDEPDDDAGADDGTGSADAGSSVPRHRSGKVEQRTAAGDEVSPGDGPTVLMTPRDDDVVVTWSGRLLVTPEAMRPEGLPAPDDVLLGLEGQPVHIQTGRDESIIARQVDYLVNSRRVRADAGSEDEAVVLTSPRVGMLTGRRLAIDPSTATGYVTGPGWLKRNGPEQANGEAGTESPTDAAEGESLAGDLEVTWQDRLDLTFYSRDESGASDGDDEASSVRSLSGLRSAVFRGEADASHPQFNLRGDELTVQVGESGEASQQGQSPSVERVDAAGNVRLAARSPETDEQIDVTSEALSIAFAATEVGDLRPTRILADGDVHATQPALTLRAQHLDITPTEPDVSGHASGDEEAEDAAADDDAGPTVEPATPSEVGIARMLATGDVDLHLVDHDLTLIGSRLVVDTPTDRIDLYGSEADPARVIQPDGALSGQHIVVGQASETVHVRGPGTIDFDTLAGDPQQNLRVTWGSSMAFDNREGTAEFVDNVVATTESATDRTRLTSAHLQLELAPADTPESEADVQGEAGGEAGADTPTHQRLQTATARDDVVFTAHTFDADSPQQYRTHARVEGPVMTFDRRGTTEQVQVLGAGRMLLIDRRADSEAGDESDSTAATSSASSSPTAGLSGRGATLFLWTENLTLDATANDMVMTGDVKMTHRPTATRTTPATPVHFDAQRLFVDFEPEQPASTQDGEGTASASRTWLDEDMSGLSIREIQAHERVLITRAPHHAMADHLRYTADDNTVTLRAEPNRIVEVMEDDQPAPITGRVISWNLQTNTFDIVEPAGVVIPLQR